MKKEFYNKLMEKGWTKKDIEQAIKTIKRGKENKSPFIRTLDTSLYWFILIVAIISLYYYYCIGFGFWILI